MNFEVLKPQITAIATNNNLSRDEKLLQICQLLNKKIDYYNWVGFYFANPENKTLHLGPYVGAATDHTMIPFGKGICGQVAVSNQNFVVPDVSAQDNYIACSFTVKSEIVVPLFVNGENIGQIDIDSHEIDPFSEADERFLEFVNGEIAKMISESSADIPDWQKRIVMERSEEYLKNPGIAIDFDKAIKEIEDGL